MTTKTGAQVLVDCLAANGADTVFGIPGESYLSVLDALYGREDIRYLVCRQEGGAAMAADAYGKLTGRPGICMVTRGPGATNASAGVHVAFQDSTPMILFIGQVGRDMIEREAFQEIDYRRMFGQMAKWVAQIDDAKRIPEYIQRAFHTATSGRPGPVVLALPEDMLRDHVDHFVIPPAYKAIEAAPAPEDLSALAGLLAVAERPFMVVGGGGWDQQACQDLLAFAEANDIALGTSFRCQDYIDNRHPNYAGHVGIGIDPALAARIKQSDLLICLGARMGEMTTSGYSLISSPLPAQKFVHIHADSEELGHVFYPTLGINATMKAACRALKAMGTVRAVTGSNYVADGHAGFKTFTQPSQSPGKMQMSAVVRHVRASLPDDAIMTNGAGNYAIWLHRFFEYRSYRTQLAPTCGSMGYGLPAALAAAVVRPQSPVVCFAGDGCFMMTCQEFNTAVQHGLKLIVIVVNNGMYGTIRMHQERNYPGRVSGTEIHDPDFAMMARAMGGHGEMVDKTEDFAAAFERACAFQGPSLIEVLVDPEALTPQKTLSQIRNAE